MINKYQSHRRNSMRKSIKRRSAIRKPSRRRRKMSKSKSRRRRKMSKSKSRRRRKMSKSKSYRFKSKKRVESRFRFNTNEKISEPLSIYTQEGCGACIEAKKICNEKGIKFNSFNRKDYEEKVKKDSNGYKYVPAIFDSNGKFIGGIPELQELTKK